MSDKARLISRSQIALNKLNTLLFLTIGAAFISWFIIHQYLADYSFMSSAYKIAVLLMGFLWVTLGWYLFKRIRFSTSNLWLSLLVFNCVYVVSEVATYAGIKTGIIELKSGSDYFMLEAFNRPCAKFDSIRGYRWSSVESRYTRLYWGELLVDHRFLPNLQGFFSNRDYQYRKSADTIRRYMVFGDSFTAAGYYLDRPWPDYLQEILEANGNNHTEVYSFAVDGSGLPTWHSIFFNDIVPNYDFDGIIIPVFGDDLERDYEIIHHVENHSFSQEFPDLPEDYDDFEKNYLPKMTLTADIFDDDSISSQIGAASTLKDIDAGHVRPGLHFLSNLEFYLQKAKHDLMRGAMLAIYKRWLFYPIRQSPMTEERFLRKYGSKRLAMIDAIVNHCKQHDKDIYLASIPEEYGISLARKGKENLVQKDLKFLSEHYGLKYFDGYEVFLDLDETFVREECFLKYDLHWSQKGSDIFAEAFAKYFLNN